MSLDHIPSPATGGTPPFADAREAKEWLKLLPLINTQESVRELSDGLNRLNASAIDALELLKTLELLRESIHVTQEGEIHRYTQKLLPLAESEMEHWQVATHLWQLLETAYARCWRAIEDGDTRLSEHHALIAERVLRYCALVGRSYQLICRPVPALVWQRLFAYYQMAETANIARTTVRDSLIEVHGSTMPQAVFIHALLLDASEPHKLSSKQLLWLDQRLEVLATRTTLAPQSPALPNKTPLQIDLSAPGPALRISKPLQGDTVREIDTLALAQVLSKRIKLLREGELPQKLGLGTELGPQAAESLLTDLYRRWCEFPTLIAARRKIPPETISVGLGLSNLYFLIGKDNVAPPPEEGPRVGRDELEQIKLFGHVAASVRTKIKRSGVIEQWEVLREVLPELQLTCASHQATQLGLHQLIALSRDKDNYSLAVIRALENEETHFTLDVRYLAGRPQAALARAIDLARLGQNQYSEVLFVHADPLQKTPAALIVPPTWYRQGRMLDIWDGEQMIRVRLVQLQERGLDFERVLFAQLK